MHPKARQAATGLQGLHVRAGGEIRGRGRGAARQGRRGPGRLEARCRRPRRPRARLHRQGQGGLLRQLQPRRRLPLCGLPLPRPTSLQAGRGGHDLE